MKVSGIVNVVLAYKKASTVWSIGPNAMVSDAIQLMGEKNVGALPVVDNGTLVGIVSERDYTRKVILRGRSSKETPVSDIMTAHGSILNQVFGSIQSFQHCLESLGIIAFAVLFQGRISETTY